MKVIRGLINLPPYPRGCVATIGNFDGVHLGHQAVFQRLMEKAGELALPAVVITFEPQPLEFFKDTQAPARLSRLREKIIQLRHMPVEHLLCLRFNKNLVHMPAEEFIERILVTGLGLKYLIVGDDFRFGYQRRGDFNTLREAGARYGFTVTDTPTRSLRDERISSTRIRALLQKGDLNGAAALLGRPYSLCGRVAHGEKRGRLIGFPTANIYLHRRASPLSGVFAVYMHGLEGHGPVAGVANLGSRPTVNGTRCQLEVHLFNFDKNIYGHYVDVEFVRKLREERRFDSFEALREQIVRDAAQAEKILRANK